MKRKSITIDEFCNQPPGTFQKFIKKENDKLRQIEEERTKRIRNRKK